MKELTSSLLASNRDWELDLPSLGWNFWNNQTCKWRENIHLNVIHLEFTRLLADS